MLSSLDFNILFLEKHFCFSLTYSLRSQFPWFNKGIRINKKLFHFQDFSKENTNFLENLCKPSGVFKSCSEIKTEYNLEGKMCGFNFFMQFQTNKRV